MPPSALLNELIGQIYDCAIYAERWPDTLEKLASVVSGSSVALTLNSMRNPGFQMHASWGLDPDFEAAMLANYAINPLVPMIWYLGEEEVFSVFGVLQPDEVENSLFFERTHKKFGVGDSAIGVLAKSISHFGSISIQRSVDQQPFTPGDVEFLQSLTPHLRRAVMISDMLHERALERNRMQSLLNLLSVGVLLADPEGRLLHTNSRAQQFLEDGRILRSGDGFVGGTGSRNAAALRAAILRAASGTAAELAMSAGETAISGAGVPDLAVWILPLDRGLRHDLGSQVDASVAIFVRELGNASPMPGELFVRRYSITAAESRVLMLIVQGMSAQQAASTLGVSIETVRSHIKSLLDKTGTERQTDLVRLALSALSPANA